MEGMKGGMEGMKRGIEGMKGGMERMKGGREGEGGGGTNGGENDLWRGREWYWASSLFVVTSLSCFVALFSPCPPCMSLLTCPRCHIVLAWVVHHFVVSVSRWWWFSCVVAAVYSEI